MYSILLVLAATIPLQYIAHELPYEVNWKTKVMVSENIQLKSTLQLGQWKIERIEKILQNVEYLFFNEFENSLDPDCVSKSSLEIRIISKEMLTNKEYFKYADSTNFGRYFVLNNILYVAHDVFWNAGWLAHEMAHYYYDECKINFNDLNEEHIRAYKFQYIYENWGKE